MEGKLLADCKMFACVCLDYYWNLDEKNINSDEAILSEMLEFRKQPMFRLGFRNGRETQVVSFSSMNHHSTGTNLLFITLKINEDNPVMMIAKKFRDLRVQTYSFNVPDRLEGMVSLKFRVYVDGAAASYAYKQSDELLKSQLWSAAQQRHCTDVELVINGANHVMAAHRAVLSARSPVFQAMFEENRSDKSGKIHVSDVDPAIFEHFLRFIYTGELQTTTNKSLATLAAKYQVETLLKLCENTDNKGVPQVEDVPVLLMSMKPVKPSPTQPGRLTQMGSYEGEPVKKMQVTELRFNWRMEEIPDKDMEATHTFLFQSEKAFHVGVQNGPQDKELTLYFFSTHHQQIGFNILDIRAFMGDKMKAHRAIHMERFNEGPPMVVEMYQSVVTLTQAPCSVTIQLSIESAVPRFSFQPCDKNMKSDLWSAFINRQHTDVDLMLDQVVMEAHRAVLVSRSPVFLAMLGPEPPTRGGQRCRIQIEGTDISVFEEFLYFMYTGTLKGSTNCHQLLTLAEKYQVETLKLLCQHGINKRAAIRDISAIIMMAS